MTREQRKMSCTPQEVELAKRREAVRLLSWGRSLDHRPVPIDRFYNEKGWTYR